jgi:hypothetical protein
MLMRVSEAGWVAAAPRAEEPPFLGAVCVYEVLSVPCKIFSGGGVC